jgi:hypothetical protein
VSKFNPYFFGGNKSELGSYKLKSPPPTKMSKEVEDRLYGRVNTCTRLCSVHHFGPRVKIEKAHSIKVTK